ncbi:MAG: N-acetylmuramic acid 6-phosphate etherase [Clostridia bacterium]|nr:N-acetylmuramic acid 6-phosphate etherase [Clostridia bacterium]MBQ9798248.1 N-acetylmuramic acid 6-phosphate etherase [Clostridia bacterium]
MLKTEERNTATIHIDRASSAEMLVLIQNENRRAVDAIDAELEHIARAVDGIVERMRQGGRLFYVGCGTSGRLGVLDASECPPTFGVSPDLVVGIIAGGDGALRHAVEGAEDSDTDGARDLSAYSLTELDSVVGISVAGGASYVLGALRYAKEMGAFCVALSCNKGCPIEEIADVGIHPDTGAEVIAGSTRMKAGSAHKMILNMISTSVMIQLGHVYENLMINLRPTNRKLRARMIRIVGDICGVTEARAEVLLEENGFEIRRAVEAEKKARNAT